MPLSWHDQSDPRLLYDVTPASCDIHCLAHHFCVATAAKNPRVIVYSSSFIRLVYTRKDDVKRAGAWAPLSLVSLARPSRGERGSGCEAHASQTLSSHRRVSGLANETTSERAGCM